jgi:hypothetical protein
MRAASRKRKRCSKRGDARAKPAARPGELEAANGRKGRSVRRRRRPKPLPLSGSSGREGPRPDAAKEAPAGSNVRRGFEGGPAKASRLLSGTRSEARGSQDRKRPIRPVETYFPLAGECSETRKVGAGGNASPHYFVGRPTLWGVPTMWGVPTPTAVRITASPHHRRTTSAPRHISPPPRHNTPSPSSRRNPESPGGRAQRVSTRSRLSPGGRR